MLTDRRAIGWAILGAALFMSATPAVRAGIIYDAAAALLADETLPGAENGRNGVWTYGGYDPTLRVFTPFTAAEHLNNWPVGIANPPPTGTFQGYGSISGDQTPTLVVNTDAVNARSPGLDVTPISAGHILMHPSSPGGNNLGDVYDVPVLRWTAPATGLISLTARWVQRHTGAQQGLVLTNGVTLFTALATPGEGTTRSLTNLAVTAGETVEVALEPGPAQYYSGSTEVDMIIDFTVTTPQPIVISLQPANLTVLEGASATFQVAVTNFDPVGYQWQRNSNNLAGADRPVLTLARAGLADDGAFFRCVITNTIDTNTSANARLTVLPDTTAPTIVSVQNDGATTLVVIFSEPVEAVSAANRLNYTLDHDATVAAVALGSDDHTVVLTASVLVSGVPYTLTVNNVCDRAAAANPVAPNSRFVFTPLDYVPHDIGNPLPGSSVAVVTNGFDITAGGQDIGGTADQFNFSFQRRSGNFDIQVRIESFDLSDAWAKAGLMARETTNANSRFASVLATPSLAGTFFLSRATTGGNATPTGASPVNYPHTWLRLRRAGNLFNGYASVDGERWAQLGSVSMALPNTLYFGMAVASHSTNQTTTVQFRDVATAVGGTFGVTTVPFEPLAACSRRTGLVLSEIMYHPAPRADGKNLQFVELFNPQSFDEDLSGYRLAGDIGFTFPAGTRLRAGAFAVVAKSPADVQTVYGLTGALGPFTNNLPNGSGTVRLRNEQDAIVLDVNYDSQAPWPCAADGAGHSLVLAHPSYGEGDPRAWGISDVIGGSPGRADGWSTEPLRTIVVNEFLANSDPPGLDFVELYNASNQTADLSGAWLSDDLSTNKFRIPDGTLLGPRGFVSFDETTLGFGLSKEGEEIALVNSNRTRVIDALRFGGQAPGVSRGRSPDGSPLWSELAVPTPGTDNSSPLARDMVINEIMFDPISGSDDDEYVELYNRGAHAMDLGGWRLSGGMHFAFPASVTVAPGGYLVIGVNVTNLLAKYPNLTAANTLGGYSGSLKNGGERIALEMPLVTLRTNIDGAVITNLFYSTVNEVAFQGGGRWGRWSGGGGSSLELIDPRSDNRFAANWADSDETAKAPWTTVEHTGVLDWGSANYAATNLQILLLGEGECLVDDVEVLNGGPNLVANGTFENGTNRWFFEGNHDTTFLETNGGFNSARSLHLRAGGDGDSYANRVLTPLTRAIASGATATLRAKVRWLRGHPEILLRLRGNWLEAAGSLPVPPNCGTPGVANSRAVANAGPAISEVTHQPTLPAALQPVIVTARVQDPDGIGSVQLHFRVDPASTFSTVMMVDDGTGGDALARDGTFSATLPGRSANALIAFYVEASDASVTPATARFPNDAPVRECLVRFGEVRPFGSFGTYRLWLTQAAFNRWSTRSSASKQPLDATLVVDSQRVIYNLGARYSGSPAKVGSYNGPAGNPCDYHFQLPPDDCLLGATSAEVAFPGNLNGDVDGTGQREQVSFWIARRLGLPYVERRFVNLFVNGARRGLIMDDAQTQNGDMVQERFSDDAGGDLFKSTIWWEVDQGQAELQGGQWGPCIGTVDLTDYLTTGNVKKTARYRWNLTLHGMGNSANDYSRLFQLVDALNSPASSYTAAVEGLVDAGEWMGMFAYEHLVGQWDSLGYRSSANMYLYKGQRGRWTLLPWDVDISFIADGPRTDLFLADYAVMRRMAAHPPFRRAYWRALQDAANGPLTKTQSDAMMDARYAGLLANGIAAARPDSIKYYISQRRAYILEQLATVAAPFAVSGPASFGTSSNWIMLRGSAPVEIASLTVNGTPWTVTWTSVTNWEIHVALAPGVNAITLVGLNGHGQPVAGAGATLNVTCGAAAESPRDHVVISEIMSHPAVAGAEYVELHNRSALNAFDLSRWRIDGIDCTIPDGTLIGPGEYAVFGKDPAVFAATYGPAVPLAGVFDGRLDPAGETLRLIKPGVTNEVINAVRYENQPPWPAGAAGSSLQLIDPDRDNSRVSNWAVASTNAPSGPAWQHIIATGTATSSSLYIYLQTAGDVFLDDISLVAGTQAAVGTNLLVNGDFETAFPGPWGVASNHAASQRNSTTRHSGQFSLHLVASSGGASRSSSVYQDVTPALINGQPYTLSYWYLPSTNGGPLTVRLSGSGVTSTADLSPGSITLSSLFTPDAANSVRASLPPFPLLWLNEVLADNLTGPADSAGHRNPWVELHNASAEALPLDGLYLSDNYANLAQWAFPSNIVLPAGGFRVVWCDGETNESSASELHAGFRLASDTGSVALSRLVDGAPQVLDYLNYHGLAADRAYGDFPDGQPFDRQVLFHATPQAANDASWPQTPLFINEWMADNTSTLPNPVGGAYDDWFELYNPNPVAVDLAGWSVANSLTNVAQNLIPSGYCVPAHGYLLIWADGKPGRNSSSHPDLHVDFKLNLDGETIALFAPDRRLVDAVIFGPQASDISQGRYPEGAPHIYSFTTPTPNAANNLVLPPPTFSGIDVSVSGVKLTFEATPGFFYRAEYADDLSAPDWTPLAPPVMATSPSLTLTDTPAAAPHRFYRVVVVP